MKLHLRTAHPDVWQKQLDTTKGVPRYCPYCTHSQVGKRLAEHIMAQHPDMHARWLAASVLAADRERLLNPV